MKAIGLRFARKLRKGKAHSQISCKAKNDPLSPPFNFKYFNTALETLRSENSLYHGSCLYRCLSTLWRWIKTGTASSELNSAVPNSLNGAVGRIYYKLNGVPEVPIFKYMAFRERLHRLAPVARAISCGSMNPERSIWGAFSKHGLSGSLTVYRAAPKHLNP